MKFLRALFCDNYDKTNFVVCKHAFSVCLNGIIFLCCFGDSYLLPIFTGDVKKLGPSGGNGSKFFPRSTPACEVGSY